ncbi:MAG: hypothetical protein JW395_1983 [Nitrospira sp.]|nr:hypothetical protein [Nitrospira sp.]
MWIVINKNGANFLVRAAAILFVAAALSACQVTIIVEPAPVTTTTFPPPPPPPCAGGGVCNVGDTGPGGGIVFYIDLALPEGQRYWEAGFDRAPNGSTQLTQWCNWSNNFTDGLPTTIGAGESNTDLMLNLCWGGNYPEATAAAMARNYRITIYGTIPVTDWFLPSKDELNAYCRWYYGRLTPQPAEGGCTGSPQDGDNFSNTWSSSSLGSPTETNAWSQQLGQGSDYLATPVGSQDIVGKVMNLRVIPVRSF